MGRRFLTDLFDHLDLVSGAVGVRVSLFHFFFFILFFRFSFDWARGRGAAPVAQAGRAG